MVPKLQRKKGHLVTLPNETAKNVVRLSPSEREMLSKLVEEAKDNIADMRENDSADPQAASKGKSDEAIAGDLLSSLMREVTELLEPVEIPKRKERAMSKMINNCIRRTLTELAAEISNQKLTPTQEKEQTLLETNELRNAGGGTSNPRN